MMQKQKNILLSFAVILIAGAIWYFEAEKQDILKTSGEEVRISPITKSASSTTALREDRTTVLKEKAAKYLQAKELAYPQGFINTEAFKLADFVGKKVILLDFWTYSCINCQRTIPHLNEWYQKYKDKGFIIVGVHTPEFEFEKDYKNVSDAVSRFGIKYPVVLDSIYGTWTAYSNRYWPREFLIDIDGFVVHDHIGEGSYDETEKLIQELLRERTVVIGDQMAVTEKITATHADDIAAESPETYFGSNRNELLANGVSKKEGVQSLKEPREVNGDKLYLVGEWNIMPEYAETAGLAGAVSFGSDRINYRYRAKRVYFVAGAASTTEVEVLRDGKPIDATAKGTDIFYSGGKSFISIKANRLYSVIEDASFGEHVLEFIILAPGLKVYTFTFG